MTDAFESGDEQLYATSSGVHIPFLTALRRHHALEHATIAVLHQRRGRLVSVAGLSDPSGFRIFGPFDAAEIELAAREALDRLRAGEAHLAISHFCGTNIATTGAFAGLAAIIAAGRDRRAGWPNAIAAATVATIAAARAGLWLQRYVSTDANVGNLRIAGIQECRPLGGNRQVRVALRGG